MLDRIRLNDDILKRLENVSNEKGLSPEIIANDLLDKGLDDYIPVSNNPEKTISVDSIIGIIEDDCPLNSVELKKELYK